MRKRRYMIFSGIQKLTLLDYPGVVACTVFTGGCNFQCPFCHNASLALPGREREEIPEAEILAFLEKRRGLLDGVAVTGGEPLMHDGLPGFLKRARELGYKIKLDTNGAFPDRLRDIVEAGLADRIAMDIKSSRENYALAVGLPELDTRPVEESAAYLMSGVVDYEFRTTCVKGIHTMDDLRRIGEWIRGAREYYLQSFSNSGDLISGEGLGAFSGDEMQTFLGVVEPNVPSVALRGM